MAKRHHSSKHGHSGHRHDGIHKHVKHHTEHEVHHSPVPGVVHGGYRMRDAEQYTGHEESRRMMARDGRMIYEDHGAPSLLPTHVIDRDWPRASNYYMGYVDTLFSGVQNQLHQDTQDFGKEFKPKKY